MRPRRGSATCQSTNLYCAQCNSQIGIFENEWEHLTSSYAKPKEKGISFNTEARDKTQTVPSGPAQKAAEGCVMAEVVCKRCSSMVGQYCKSASHPDKEHLVNQQFYKLSRVYLKDAQSFEKIEPTFTDSDTTCYPLKPSSFRSMAPKVRQERVHTESEQPIVQLPNLAHSANTSQIGIQHHVVHTPPTSQSNPTPTSYPVSQPGLFSTPPSTNRQIPYQAIPSEQYRVTPLNDTPVLSQELYDQTISIRECMNRLASAEGRINNEAVRLTNFESRIFRSEERSQRHDDLLTEQRNRTEMLRSDLAEQQSSYLQLCERSRQQQHGIDEQQEQIKVLRSDLTEQQSSYLQACERSRQQQHKIDEQQEQIKMLSEKLETVQQTLVELKERIHVNESPAAESSSPPTWSRDFLKNLEIMVRTIRSASRGDSETESLCHENQSMNAHLKLLASSIGAKSRGNNVSDLSTGSQCDAEEPLVLKKRKRNSFSASAKPAKILRQAKHLFADPEEPPTALLTPESTQDDTSCLTDPHGEDEASTDPSKDQDANLDATYHEVNDTDVVVINDDDMEPPEIILEASDGNEVSKGLPGIRSVSETREDTVREAAAFKEHPAVQTHQAQTDAASTGPIQATQLVHVPKGDQSYDLEALAAYQDIYGPFAPHNYPYRPVYPIRRSNISFFNAPSPVPSFFNGHSLPATHALHASYVNRHARLVEQHARSSEPAGTFSGAIMRGQRLEEIIQKSAKATSMPKYTAATSLQGKQATRSKQGDARQLHKHSAAKSREHTTPQAPDSMAQSSNVAHVNGSSRAKEGDIANTDAIDLSDKDEGASLATKTAGMGPQISIEEARGSSKSTLISRTIRGLTLEPLTRPVIEAPPPRAARRKDTMIQSNACQRSTVMPEFMAAIQNLDGSAARLARTQATGPKTSRSPARSLIEQPSSEKVNVAGKNELLPRVLVNATLDPANPSAKSKSSPAQKASSTELPLAENPTSINKKPLSGSANSMQGRPTGPGRALSAHTKENDPTAGSSSVALDNDDYCAVCRKAGKLLCCDGCPKSYHRRCLTPEASSNADLEGEWFCPTCFESKQRNVKDAQARRAKASSPSQLMIARNKLAQETLACEDAAESP